SPDCEREPVGEVAEEENEPSAEWRPTWSLKYSVLRKELQLIQICCELRMRMSHRSTEKEIDWLSDYYSKHAAWTFIPSETFHSAGGAMQAACLMKTCSKLRNDQETEILMLVSEIHPRHNFTR
ncbi:hypothetical protein X777_08683, partial [Ooceraea biroi]